MKNYGSIMTGLIKEENIDPKKFNDYVFNVPIEKFITPNYRLKVVLKNHPQIKTVIFSNSPIQYIERLLDCLGIHTEIQGIYDRTFMNYLSKPNPKAFKMVLDELDAKGDECILVDDRATNLEVAKMYGIVTVFIGYGQELSLFFIDHQINEIHEIGEVLDKYP